MTEEQKFIFDLKGYLLIPEVLKPNVQLPPRFRHYLHGKPLSFWSCVAKSKSTADRHL